MAEEDLENSPFLSPPSVDTDLTTMPDFEGNVQKFRDGDGDGGDVEMPDTAHQISTGAFFLILF